MFQLAHLKLLLLNSNKQPLQFQVVGASFILLQVVEGGRSSSLSIVEDGFVAQLTKEQFKALLSHIRSASPLQLRVKIAKSIPDSLLFLLPSQTPACNSGALITLDWVDESPSMHPTSVHVSFIFSFCLILSVDLRGHSSKLSEILAIKRRAWAEEKASCCL